MRSVTGLQFALATAIAIGGIWAAKADGEAPTHYKPSEVVANEDTLNGKHVIVEGLLQNKGRNLFIDRRLVLIDASGDSKASLPVKEWLPFEVPPNSSGQDQRPAILSDYLGKKVVLEGTIKDDVLRGFGQVKYLQVESARIVEEQK